MKLTLISSLVFLVSLLGCANTNAKDNKLALREIKVGQHERSYYIRYPQNFSTQSRLPLLIVLHGGDRKNGDETAERTGFADLADRENFIAVFPNGFKGKWHDGRLPKRKVDKYKEKEKNDIAFINAMIDYLIKYEQVDPNRIYLTGLSNGGMMTMRMACESSERFAAVAPVIANMPVDILDSCKPLQGVSFLLMNGTEDPLVPWSGGEVKALFKKRGKVISADATFSFWLAKNQCDLNSRQVSTLANTDVNDMSVIDKISYQCLQGVKMLMYRVRGGGHTLPGSNIKNRPRLLGNKNMDANGAELIWEFLKQQQR